MRVHQKKEFINNYVRPQLSWFIFLVQVNYPHMITYWLKANMKKI